MGNGISLLSPRDRLNIDTDNASPPDFLIRYRGEAAQNSLVLRVSPVIRSHRREHVATRTLYSIGSPRSNLGVCPRSQRNGRR